MSFLIINKEVIYSLKKICIIKIIHSYLREKSEVFALGNCQEIVLFEHNNVKLLYVLQQSVHRVDTAKKKSNPVFLEAYILQHPSSFTSNEANTKGNEYLSIVLI